MTSRPRSKLCILSSCHRTSQSLDHEHHHHHDYLNGKANARGWARGVNGRLARRYSVSQVLPPAQICHNHPDHPHHLRSGGFILSCATQIIMLSSSSLYSKSPSGQYWERASPSNWSWSGSSWVSWLACGHAYQLHLKNFSAVRKMQCNSQNTMQCTISVQFAH